MLGVSGGIAAYKAVEVCRRLVDSGAWVSPVMTAAAARFIGPTTLSALASEPVRTSMWDGPETIPHTRLGQGADLVLVVPATARLIGAYRAGISSDLLTATLLATRAPVVICPAMHTEMWEHPAVRENVEVLRRRGVHVVEPVPGRLAGGDIGAGRLADPADIVAVAAAVLAGGTRPGAAMAGLRAVVTAGGTREPIDPVRFIGNRSSGKQGHALAGALARRGAEVTLISAAAEPAPPGVDLVAVETAADMDAAVRAHEPEAAVIVMAAAVADFAPKSPATLKLKKADGPPEVVLEPTVDILAGLGRRWAGRPGRVLVGFAAETVAPGGPTLAEMARGKLAAKGADLVVANDVATPGAGFTHDTNEVVIVGRGELCRHVSLRSKDAVAEAVVDAVCSVLSQHQQEKHDQP